MPSNLDFDLEKPALEMTDVTNKTQPQLKETHQ